MKVLVNVAMMCLLAAPAFSQSATQIACPAGNQTGCYAIEAQAAPTGSAVTVSSVPVVFGGGWIGCTSNTTLTLTDGNNTVIGPPGGISITAGQLYSLNLLAGTLVSKSLKVLASGTGCNYHLWWRI